MAHYAVAQDAIVGQTLRHNRVAEKIRAGGMCEVYRAHDEHLDREVAIKVFPPGTLADEHSGKRFSKETSRAQAARLRSLVPRPYAPFRWTAETYVGRALAFVLLVGFGSGHLFAQATATGAIQGMVTDTRGAVVIGAQVQAIDSATGASRTTTSNESGNYRFELLPATTYQIRAGKTGFVTSVQNLELLIGQTVTANVVLKVGVTTEVVEVVATTSFVDSQKTSVSQFITPSQVEQLPMLGRDVANLAYLAPGVRPVTTSYDPTKTRYAQLSVDGQGGRNVNVTINGVDNKDNTVGGPVMQVPAEAVSEFIVSSQRFSAANGRSEGAAINLVTKSGANRYHGSLFGFFRDQTLNAIDYESAKTNGSKPQYSRQWFGGSIGGPLRKDTTFGFFAIERQREATALPESAIAYKELVLAEPLGAQPATSIPTPFYENRYNARLDYKFNDYHSSYISFTGQANNGLNDQSDGTGDLTGGNQTVNHMQVANFTMNSVLSNTLNNFTFGFQYWNNTISSNIGVPQVRFPDAWFGTNGKIPQQSFQRKWQFRDDLSKTLHNHILKMGVDYVWEPELGGYWAYNYTLRMDFADDPSIILGNPDSYPQGFSTPGAVVLMSLAGGDPNAHVPGGTKQIGVYFQDDWKVSRRLMFNVGLRWDKDFNLIGISSVGNSRTYLEMAAIGQPWAAPHDDNKDFSPRVGFAYDLTGSGRHLLRGGFGVYYGNVFQNIPYYMQQQANPTIYQSLFTISGNDIVPGPGIPLSNWRYGIDPLPAAPSANTTLNDGSSGYLVDPNYRNPYTEQFNIGYAWALASSSVLEGEYVHVLSLHEDKTVVINPKDPLTGVRWTTPLFQAAGVPVLGIILNEEAINRSRYDGMNVTFRQNMTKHFSLMANYTLSRAVGWNLSGSFSFHNRTHDPHNLWSTDNFGPSLEDERHHVTIAGVFKLPAHFQVAPVMQFGSARPYNVTEGYDVLNLGGGMTYPVVVQNSDPTNYRYFAISALGKAARDCLAVGQCHLLSYNPVRGDPIFQLDMRVSNNIKLGERSNVALIFQAFNLTNRANFGNNFGTAATSPSFMTPVGYFGPTFSPTIVARSFVGEFGIRFTF